MDRAWIGFLAFGAVIIGCYFLGDGGLIPSIVYEALAALSVVAILMGIRINRPEHRSPWFLLAGGHALFVAGDVLYTFYTHVLGVEVPVAFARRPDLPNRLPFDHRRHAQDGASALGGAG